MAAWGSGRALVRPPRFHLPVDPVHAPHVAGHIAAAVPTLAVWSTGGPQFDFPSVCSVVARASIEGSLAALCGTIPSRLSWVIRPATSVAIPVLHGVARAPGFEGTYDCKSARIAAAQYGNPV